MDLTEIMKEKGVSEDDFVGADVLSELGPADEEVFLEQE